MPWTLAEAECHKTEFDSPLAERVTRLAERQTTRGMRSPGRFARAREPLALILPSHFEGLPEQEARLLKGLGRLLESHRTSLERELGTSFDLATAGSPARPRWLVGPTRCTPELAELGLGEPTRPMVRRLPEARTLITDAPSVREIYEAFSLLRSFAWVEGDCLEAVPCRSPEDAFLRVAEEVAHTWPSFRYRNVDWVESCRRYATLVAHSDDPVTALQMMVAELGDAHTAVRKTDAVVPASIQARVLDGEVILHEVPDDCSAWHAGAREGFRLLDVDVHSGWQCIGATPHQRPFAVPFRMLSGALGEKREMVALGPSGQVVRWVESYVPRPPASLVTWRKLPSGAGYLRIRRWPSSHEFAEALDAAFEELSNGPGLIVDLRGNPGGNVFVASEFRDRFVRTKTRMGSQQFTGPDGELAESEPIWAEPAQARHRWSGPVRFLTDAATYSASEDALLGLSGLEHVEVIGMPSGGGSGRARSVTLLSGWHLTITSCLTFDRRGHCIEGAGIEVDASVPLGRHTDGSWLRELLAVADRGW